MSKVAELVLSFLVNAAWQTAVVALVAAAGARLLGRAPAKFRHSLWVAALALCFSLPALSLIDFSAAQAALGGGGRAASPSREGASASPAVQRATQSLGGPTGVGGEGAARGLTLESLTRRRTQPVSGAAPLVLALAACYALFLLRQACGLWRAWRRVVRLRRASYEREVPAPLGAVMERCREVFGLRGVALRCSAEVRSPVVVGARGPVVLLPESFFDPLPRETLTSVVGHEAAHVARRDFAVNLVCELLYLPVSFHPLARFIRRRVDRTRELACDEMVAERLLAPDVYARALVGVAGALAAAPSRALAPGVFDADILEERIMRLTRHRSHSSARAARLLTLASFAALGLSCLAASSFTVEVRARAAAIAGGTHGSGPAAESDDVSQQTGGAPAAFGEKSADQGRPSEAAQGLGSGDPRARALAACEAGHARAVELIPALVSMLGDDAPVPPVKCWENNHRWSPALDSFKQPSPGEQAAIALASMGTPSVEPLTRALGAGSAAARRNAAWAVGELTNMREDERAGAVMPLIALLGDADGWVRMAAARALGEIRDERAAGRLTLLLQDDEWRARELAAWALGEMKEESAVASLCGVLASDPRPEVRTTAAWALGEIRSREAAAALRQALNDPEGSVRDKARWALSEIEDSDG